MKDNLSQPLGKLRLPVLNCLLNFNFWGIFWTVPAAVNTTGYPHRSVAAPWNRSELNPARAQASAVNIQSIANYRNESTADYLSKPEFCPRR